jgi:hypothetical protein
VQSLPEPHSLQHSSSGPGLCGMGPRHPVSWTGRRSGGGITTISCIRLVVLAVHVSASWGALNDLTQIGVTG